MIFQLFRLLTGSILFQNHFLEAWVNGANRIAIVSSLGFLVAGCVIAPQAVRVIRLTKKDMFLSHLKKLHWSRYLFLLIATVGIGMGVSVLLSLIGLVGGSTTYEQVSSNQFSATFFLGLFSYGLISPVAEELLFRGVIYNRMRQYFDIRVAIVASAGIFAIYHGNVVQIIYAFVMGLLIAYAYEYFGSFFIPLGMHMVVNIVAYGIEYKAEKWLWLFGIRACVCMLAVGMLAFIVLVIKRKKLSVKIS